jgi:hypothetical protein
MRIFIPIIFIAGCSTTNVSKSAEVAGSYQSMTLWQTNPALATVGVYTPAVINAINPPPPPVPESEGYKVITQCGGKPCKKAHKIPRSILPTSQQTNQAKAESTN